MATSTPMCPLNRWLLLTVIGFIFLATTTNAQQQSDDPNVDEQLDEDDGAPLFNAVSGRRPPAPLPIEKIRSASFGDSNQGKIVWQIEKEQLPWHGSYSFLAKSNAEHPTVLLSVFDSKTGVKVAECQTPVTKTVHTGWREQLDQAFHWHRVSWELDSDALQCNTTADLKSIRSTIQSASSEAFIVRISAAKGPRCIRNLYADNDELTDCPPRMRMHAFQADHLNCGCPTNETQERDVTTEPKFDSVDPKVEPGHEESTILSAIEEAITTDSPIFGNVRRKPLPGRSTPPETAEEITESLEITAPAFPMFQFTESKQSETETTKDPGSSSSSIPTETTGNQQDQTTSDSGGETTLAATSEDNNSETTAASTSTGTTAEPEQCDCQNNGTCVESSKGKRECKCREGFVGKRCERDLCANFGCQNGGKCQVRNGRAVCSCPSGLHGEKCHQVQTTGTTTQQLPYCEPKCENGGVCSLGQNGPVCNCLHGFLGSNCNLKDMCAFNTTCEQYGPQARCFKDVAELTKFSPILQDATYSCQRPGETGYVECNSTIGSRSIEVPTPTHEPEDFSSPTASLSRQSSEIGSNTDGGQSEEFPQQSVGPAVQHVIGTRPDLGSASPTPQFPLTSLTSANPSPSFSQPAVTTMRILPRPSSTPASIETSGAEFPRLPASSLHPTTTTQASTSKSSNEEFERLTQVVESSTERVTDHMGPKHAVDTEGRTGSENELQPEFHTVGTVETPTITTTLITLKNSTTSENNPIEGQAENRTSSPASWTWIIALVVVFVLLISATIGALFMARYVRRSRRLHGKYNPAREENAAVPATYALPMTSVNKDERLI